MTNKALRVQIHMAKTVSFNLLLKYMYLPNQELCLIRNIITQHIHSLSINFNVYVSRGIVFLQNNHDTNFHEYRKHLSLLISNFVLCHRYEAAATEDLSRYFATSPFLVNLIFLLRTICIQIPTIEKILSIYFSDVNLKFKSTSLRHQELHILSWIMM